MKTISLLKAVLTENSLTDAQKSKLKQQYDKYVKAEDTYRNSLYKQYAEQIYQNVWDDEAYAAENIIAVHIRHIREKIEINPKEPKYLKVIWGIGYKIENLDK